jgi:glycosyltransferase involved in cell wall biosynthesis
MTDAIAKPAASVGTVRPMSAVGAKRIGVIVVAYNAASTLAQVLDRIPPSFVAKISDVLVCDDASHDATFLVGLGYQQVSELPLQIIRRERNLGYGGNQKAAYRWAIEHGLDIVVLLHGDGQYAPEHLEKMVEPLLNGECDAVFGSRMIEKGAARRGGMPRYKLVGNRILTTVQNAVVGANLSEWHSGYRAYSVAALQDIPFERNHDGFDFDTQIIIQLLEAGKRIAEIPIPTYYGDEICYVNGIGYARDVVTDSLRYRAHKIGFGSGDAAFQSRGYEQKIDDVSSHRQIVQWLSTPRPLRILDLGCSAGHLAADLRKHGHSVVGVDIESVDGVRDRVDKFVLQDLDTGLGDDVHGPFDVVLAADVLEHVRAPEQLLTDARRVLAPDGVVVACVPNFGHWYARMRVASGTFAYERRGILDAGHLRFFTRRSFAKMARECDFEIVRRRALGVPFEVLGRGGRRGALRSLARAASAVDRVATAAWPTLFGYQFLVELRPRD